MTDIHNHIRSLEDRIQNMEHLRRIREQDLNIVVQALSSLADDLKDAYAKRESEPVYVGGHDADAEGCAYEFG